MTIPRAILGRRGSEFGVFVSPPGVDASTASPSALLLHITSLTAQIVKQGVVAPSFPQTVPHLLGFAPMVFLNIVSTGLVSEFGYVRPFDNTWAPWVLSNVASSATNLVFNQTYPVAPGPVAASPLPLNYFAINVAAP